MFRRNYKNLVYLLILIVFFLLFFCRLNIFSPLKFKFIQIASLPIQILSIPFQEIKKIITYHQTFEEYQKKKAQVDQLNARLIGLDDVIIENSRLRELLGFKKRLIYSSVAVNVIGRDPSYWNSAMIIDKGQRDGIKEGQPVVNALGVVGKISEVGSQTSKVILLTDPQFSVAALIQRPRESGLVSGTLQGICRLRYLNPDVQIRVGDKVVTSKLSSSFPESLLIGEIIQIKENPKNGSMEGIVQPAVSFSQIEEVLVIIE